MATKRTLGKRKAQYGAALIVSMVMLVAITLIGVFAMNGSHLEWLMTNNSQFQSGAYRNATLALRAGLNTVPASAPNPPPTTVSSLSPSDLSDPVKWSNGSISAGCTVNCYVVEYLGCSVFDGTPTPSAHACNDLDYISVHSYRVWAYGSDEKGAARILQSTVRLIYNPSGLSPSSPNMKNPALPRNWSEIL